MSKEDTEFNVRYTNKDIMEKLESLHEKQEKTLIQAIKTNGRVNNHDSVIKKLATKEDFEELRSKSVGIWISLNPFKFIVYLLIIISIIISDLRQPLINLLLNFI